MYTGDLHNILIDLDHPLTGFHKFVRLYYKYKGVFLVRQKQSDSEPLLIWKTHSQLSLLDGSFAWVTPDILRNSKIVRATDTSCKGLVGTVLPAVQGQGHQCLRHQETPEFSFVPKYFRFHQSASNFYQLGRKVCRSWFLPPSGSTINPPSFPSDACFTLCRALQILKTLKILNT